MPEQPKKKRKKRNIAAQAVADHLRSAELEVFSAAEALWPEGDHPTDATSDEDMRLYHAVRDLRKARFLHAQATGEG